MADQATAAAEAAHHAAGGIALTSVVVLLAAAVIAVPLFRRLGLGSVLGYLAAGLAVGPFGLGLFDDPQSILHVAELGVVLFLFLIGLEMQPTRLWSMRGEIFGLGLLQVVGAAGALTCVGLALGYPAAASFVAGTGFVLTSTAIVMQMLQERGEIGLPRGRRIISILLLEDLAIVPLLALVAFLAPGGAERLRALSSSETGDAQGPAKLRSLRTLHDLRWVIFDNDTRAIFATTYDGDWDSYIDDFATGIPDMMDMWFSAFAGYPGITSSEVKDFFAENHKKFLAMYDAKQCAGEPKGSGKIPPHVAEFRYWEAIKHIYGWVPYNEGCTADDNKLSATTADGHDHAYVQSMYIQDLQYNYRQDTVKANPKLAFNPYVKLIHDDLGMSAYGFSVDDAVGFMSELGNGLVFTVGGVQGLENGSAFNYHDGFDVLLGNPADRVPENKPLLNKYGACSLGQDASDPDCDKVKQDVIMPDNNRIVGFRVGTMPSYPMKVRFTDAQDNVYTLLVKEKFATCTGPLPDCPSNACSVMTPEGAKHPKSDTWCVGANPNQSRENDEAAIKNHLSFPVPVQYLP